MAATVPVASPLSLREKELPSAATPARTGDIDNRDVEAVIPPPVIATSAQPIRPIHGWRWALGGKMQIIEIWGLTNLVTISLGHPFQHILVLS